MAWHYPFNTFEWSPQPQSVTPQEPDCHEEAEGQAPSSLIWFDSCIHATEASDLSTQPPPAGHADGESDSGGDNSSRTASVSGKTTFRLDGTELPYSPSEGGRSTSPQPAARRKSQTVPSQFVRAGMALARVAEPLVADEAQADADIEQPCSPGASATVRAMQQLVGAYVERTAVEELDCLSRMGGVEALLTELNTSEEWGLPADMSEAEIAERQAMHGVNRLPVKRPTPFIYLLWVASKDFTLRVLQFSAVISLALGLFFGEGNLEWIEGAAISVAVAVVVLVTAGNDWAKERQFRKLTAIKDDKYVTVIRSGAQKNLSVFELLVGDILEVELGDEVPVDGIVIESHSDFRVDESSVTGESDAIRKRPYKECLDQMAQKSATVAVTAASTRHRVVDTPILLSGSYVARGSAKILCIGVGSSSYSGLMFEKADADTETTPLQNKLNALSTDIGIAGTVGAVLTFSVMFLEYWAIWLSTAQIARDGPWKIAVTMVDFVVQAITILVVAIPEGLPLAVTISLAFSVGKMLKDKNYVRTLAACETMGGAGEVCSDKTGTLTKNQMAVQALWNGSQLRENFDPDDADSLPPSHPLAKQILAESIAINSTAHLEVRRAEVGVKPGEVKDVVKQVGSATECALLQFMMDCHNVNYDDLRHAYRDKDHLIHVEPFSSERKMSATIVRRPNAASSSAYRVYVKGAAETVLQLCNYTIDLEGRPRKINRARRDRIESQVINNFASKALRTLCVAYKDFDAQEFPDWRQKVSDPIRVKSSGDFLDDSPPDLGATQMEKSPSAMNVQDILANSRRSLSFGGGRRVAVIGSSGEEADETDDAEADAAMRPWAETDLTCLAIFGISDPVRDEVPAAVRKCQKAGVRVRMVTGDNMDTARQIAWKCNIYRPDKGGLVLLGRDFYDLVGKVVCSVCGAETCSCPTDADRAVREGRPQRKDVLGNPDAFMAIKDKLDVLARSQPRDKYALVTGLKNAGSVVAVTGDGTNDAPALRKADIGFAMGIAGKEAAKQAADIVLLDDNFESLVKAISWGRNIYDNIRRFLQFQLTVNIVAVTLAVFGAVVLRDPPLTAVQLLWVNLIMDSFASLALATEPPDDTLLERGPHSRHDYLINRVMWRNILGQAFYQLCILVLIVMAGDMFLPDTTWNLSEETRNAFPEFSEFSDNGMTMRSGRRFFPFSHSEDYKQEWTLNIGPSRHYTFVFNTFVMMQLFNLINARKINNEINVFSGIFSNAMWLIVAAIILFGQIVLVQFGGRALNCHLEGLTTFQWFLSAVVGAGGLLFQLVLRLLPSEVLPESGIREEVPNENAASVVLALKGRSHGRLAARMFGGLGVAGGQALDDDILVRRRALQQHLESLRLSQQWVHSRFRPRMATAASQMAKLAQDGGGTTAARKHLLSHIVSGPCDLGQLSRDNELMDPLLRGGRV